MAIEAIGMVGGMGQNTLVDSIFRQQVDRMTGAGGVEAPDGAAAARGADFAAMIGQGLGQLGAMEQTTTTRAAQAATGDLENIHDYVIAATSMQTATELTTTIRNKGLEAFNEIMRMQL